jgi:predicted CxxxxCH...CXXCH cytochrome family protein
MKHQLLILLIALGLALVAWSCSELKQDLPSPVTSNVQIHPEGWGKATSSPDFHGTFLKTKADRWSVSECQRCHGASFTGGTSSISCYTCHDAYPHTTRFTNGHTGYLYAKGYPLDDCKVCHGTTYDGGDVAVGCTKSGCHVDRTGAPKSPEACNTCHGNFSAPTSDRLSAAPPKSVLGDSLTTVSGVGAHQKHLASGTIGRTLKCKECHTVPTRWDAAGHVDTPLPAEVIMIDTLATFVTGDGSTRPAPVYTGGKCSNTYCHGNWVLRKATSTLQFAYTDSVMMGAMASPSWTGGSNEAACGTCHDLPPKGHIVAAITDCWFCHSEVVDNTGAIINKANHLNGKINYFSTERSMH